MKIKKPSKASLLRYNHALKLVMTCPASLFDEVALTGASAKGIADDTSQIRISFWGKQIPLEDQRIAWLTGQGVTGIQVSSQPRMIESDLITGVYQGIPLSTTWQTADVLMGKLNMIINANTTDHGILRLADIILSAVSLRGSGVLEYWQNRLSYDYSDVLQTRLIQDSFTKWGRGNYSDQTAILRAIFAINRVWEFDWPRWHYEMDKLRHLPPNFTQRLTQDDLMPLILDTLGLIEVIRPDLSGFIEAVRARINA